MERDRSEEARGLKAGIRLNYLNLILILVGLVIAALMVITMFQTRASVESIVSTTEIYLEDQATGGMLQSIVPQMTETAIGFVQSGDPGLAMAYEGQMNALNEQVIRFTASKNYSEEANASLNKAIYTYRQMYALHEHAMALAARNMPEPAFKALPAFLQEATLSEQEMAMSAEERTGKAMAILTSEDMRSGRESMDSDINTGHRTASEQASAQAEETHNSIRRIITAQIVLVFLIMLIAAGALMLNRFLIISPIQRSVHNLDRREPIPVKGSYEMRHLAQVYNDVLKDNEEKKEALSYTASHDALTDLFNRGEFDRTYKEFLDQHIGIIVADVDHFKTYNDQYGHDIGDRVLCIAAETLRQHFRREDYIFRIGGDEFCVIMPDTSQSHGEVIREKILEINQELAERSTDFSPITLTAGIAFWDRPCPKGNLFKDADSMLLELKKTHGSVCEIYPGSMEM